MTRDRSPPIDSASNPEEPLYPVRPLSWPLPGRTGNSREELNGRGDAREARRCGVRDDPRGENQLRAEQLPRGRPEARDNLRGIERIHFRVPRILPAGQVGAVQAVPDDPR